ncbi:hypothetical protein RQP53_24660 [Paucibacter sp. APW11]|uniref:Uridine kinase n=1 Tax=Roseateles aquae TaxID=3077235 RepID=A0ABU3PJA2_9BURK|nr:hypothetical protein [Paucibacter sp. APW11]MDT9002487.1 hypothetical protein [Paucibacter sp. APW11]
MPSIATVSSLQDALRQLPRGSLVGLDGFMSSGKTHLATALAESLGGMAIHTDDLVEDGDESLPYLGRLDLAKLKAILSGPAADAVLILVEGICLRETLGSLGIDPAAFVYVKRIAQNGLWHDGLHLEDFENGELSPAGEPERSRFVAQRINQAISARSRGLP